MIKKINALVSVGEEGAILILFALVLPVLLAIGALFIDVGYSYQVRRSMQSATDAAAVAGAFELKRGNGAGQIDVSAKAAFAINGFANGIDENKALINWPPKMSNNFANNAAFVEAILSKPSQTFFAKLFGFDTVGITVVSVAGLTPSGACVIALDPNAHRAMSLISDNSIDASCGFAVNSTASDALYNSSSKVTASSFTVVGGAAGQFSPAPQVGASVTPDPFAGLAKPEAPANLNRSSGSSFAPGLYHGINATGDTVTFAPGLYFIDGGGLSISSASTVTGVGVTFFLTCDSSYSYNPLNIQSPNSMSLSAPVTGANQGILFWGDSSCGTSSSLNQIHSGDSGVLTGAIYFPNQKILLHSGNQWTINGPIIGNTVEANSMGSTTIKYDNLIPAGADVSVVQ